MTNPDNPNIINFDLWKQAAGGRHQIGTLAGFKSEQVAGFLLECMAGFVGIRSPPSRRICAAVSGPPFAFAGAFRTWLTNDVERRPARLPRSRIRPDRGRKSEASSWLIRERLRQLRPNASLNRRTSCHVVEKERQCGKTHIAQNRGWQKKTMCRQGLTGKRKFAFILPS